MKYVSYFFALMALFCIACAFLGAPHQIFCGGIFAILHMMTLPEEEKEGEERK